MGQLDDIRVVSQPTMPIAATDAAGLDLDDDTVVVQRVEPRGVELLPQAGAAAQAEAAQPDEVGIDLVEGVGGLIGVLVGEIHAAQAGLIDDMDRIADALYERG